MNLYKMILVDDEEDVRVSIAKKVDWNALGFEVIGSVSNGEEALELTEHMHVDVVLTDIKMPFMDGLQLCAKVKENYKNTRVVLYSGFDEFELAREAIHLEAEEYLLKPIGSKDLENVFRRIKTNLDQELDERNNLKNLNDYYQKSLPLMREQLLAGLLDGKFSNEHAKRMIESYEMDLISPFYSVALLKRDSHKKTDGFQEDQLRMISQMNLAKEYFEDNIKCHIFMYLGNVVIIAQMEQADEIHQFVYHMNQVCKMGDRMLDMDSDAGIGSVCSELSQIHRSYEEARTALDYRVLGEEKGQAIYINDVEPKSNKVVWHEWTGIQEIIHSMKFGTEEELKESIDCFIEEMKSENMVTVQQFQLVFMEILTEMMKLMRSYQLDASEVFGKNIMPYQEAEKIHLLEELEEWLQSKCFCIWKMIRNIRTSSTNALTDKAKAYIEEYYMKSDLSVEELCKYLNVSTSYFSTMFKKEIGMSFVSYLTKVRMEHAVDLLNNTEDKSYVIAWKVGYTEANYFSYVFKKQYGVSPSKYRTKKES